jgi:hypothetical protein
MSSVAILLLSPDELFIASAASHCLTPMSSSIAFYIIVSAFLRAPDISGGLWEWQLPAWRFAHTLTYVSDGKLMIWNRSSYVSPGFNGRDIHLCSRTSETINHFRRYNWDKRWYFRSVHNTFVNITNLQCFLLEPETKCDPMKETVVAYNIHCFRAQCFPQGGAGWLASNFAAWKFFKDVVWFRQLCALMKGTTWR